jgi:hypothetical protein
VVQTPAVKIGETINRRRVETSLCLEDLAEGSRVSVFVPCSGGMVEAGTGSAIPPQRWAVAISPIHTRLSEPQYRQSADHQAVHALNKALERAELLLSELRVCGRYRRTTATEEMGWQYDVPILLQLDLPIGSIPRPAVIRKILRGHSAA